MDVAVEPSTLTGTALERVPGLTDVILAGGDEAQLLRRVPQSTIDALIDAGMFRFTLPHELGGENATVQETIEVLEAISAIDGSVGWNVMLGSEINAMAAGGMDPALAKKVYLENPRVVMCGGGGPGTKPSRAVRTDDGGYQVWGQSTFISGCHNATWCFMAAPVHEGDQPRLNPDGSPFVRMFFLHRDQWEILDTWDVAGLRGSGSHDVMTEGGIVPPEFADVGLVTFPAHYPNPVYRIPVPLRLAYNKAAVAIGVARGTLDAFVDLAATKVPFTTTALLRDRPVAQQRMGEATATFRSARAYLFEAMTVVTDELEAGRDLPSAEATQNARLACTHAANACMEVVDLIHNTAGTSAHADDEPARAQAARRPRLRDAPLGGPPALRRDRQALPRPRARARVRRLGRRSAPQPRGLRPEPGRRDPVAARARHRFEREPLVWLPGSPDERATSHSRRTRRR